MDYRIFPGIISKEERILSICKEYLGINEPIVGRRSDIVSCKILVTLLMVDFYGRTEILEKIGEPVGADHSTVLYYKRKYGPQYHGKSRFLHFEYMNVKNRLLGLKYYHISDFVAECRRLIPEDPKIATDKFLLAFFLKNQVSLREAYKFCGRKYQRHQKYVYADSTHIKLKDPTIQLMFTILEDMIETTTAIQNEYYEKRKVTN